jgi:general secretion pathway protein D
LDVGIKLDVTPHVYRDEEGVYVQLDLKPEVSFYKGMNQGVPIRAVRSSETTTNVRDGQTLVIGGIVLNEDRNVESRVPGLGKMPVVGALFRHKERAKERKELMVFVTPTVHETPDSITWDKMLNLSIATEPQGQTVPSRETRRETRKD